MDELLPILVRGGKFVLATGLLTLLYLWLFRGKASYNLCRLYLLSIPLLAVLVSQFHVKWNATIPDVVQTSVIVPLRSTQEIERAKTAESVVSTAIETTPKISKIVDSVEQPNRGGFLLLFYLSISLILMAVFFKQVNKIVQLRRKGLRKMEKGIEVVIHPEVPTPFSFYKTIFLNDSLTGSKLELVLKHERYHIVHKHYVDVMLVQLLVRLAWFNPIHWWIRKELVSLNEFQADQSVLNEGLDLYHYQTVILEEVMATDPFLASGMNDSFTKRRFVMMKQQPSNKLKALRRVSLIPFLFVLFAVFSLTIQGNTDYDKMTPIAAHLSNLNSLGQEWDEQSSSNILSESLEREYEREHFYVAHSQAYFSYRLNEDTLVSKQVVEDDLEALSKILRLVVNEVEAHDVTQSRISGSKNSSGSFSTLTTLLDFLHYNIDDRYLGKVNCQKSTAFSMDQTTRTDALTDLKALGKMAKKTALSSLNANDKLLKFKYLAFRITANALVWAYLEPQMVQLALEGQTTQRNIVFYRLGRGRLRNQLNDARIWSQAPRFNPAQVSVCRNDAGYTSNGISSIRRTRKATRVTLHYLVGGDEWWFYFDKGLSLIDRATKDIYLIKKMDRDIPLSQTLVVTGCCNRYVEFTLIFPPLPESVTAVDMREFIADRSNIMSDGSGETRYDNLSLKEFALK